MNYTNNKLINLQSERVQVVKNDTINLNQRNLFVKDGVQLSTSGNLELVRLIKSHLNPVLGLRSYTKPGNANHNNSAQNRQSHYQSQSVYGQRHHGHPQFTPPPRFENTFGSQSNPMNRNGMFEPPLNPFGPQSMAMNRNQTFEPPLSPINRNNSNWYRDRELIMRLLDI